MIREKVGEILHAKVLSNGNVSIFCKSEAQRTKAMSIKNLDGRVVESYIPGFSHDQGLKGVIYGVDIAISEYELLRYLEGAEVIGVSAQCGIGKKGRPWLC